MKSKTATSVLCSPLSSILVKRSLYQETGFEPMILRTASDSVLPPKMGNSIVYLGPLVVTLFHMTCPEWYFRRMVLLTVSFSSTITSLVVNFTKRNFGTQGYDKFLSITKISKYSQIVVPVFSRHRVESKYSAS